MIDKMAAQRAAQLSAIAAGEREFISTGNPVFVWDAYLRARHEGLPIPEWICCYLDDVARQLGALVAEAEAGRSISKPDAQIARAFQMKAQRGENTVFAQFVHRRFDFEWLAIGVNVAEQIRGGLSETSAIEFVAAEMDAAERVRIALFEPPPTNNPISSSTVRRAWLRYKQERL